MKNLIFLCIAASILLFSIIVVNIAPAINHLVDANNWMENSCKFQDDNIKINEDLNAGDEVLKPLKKNRDRCKRKQAMVGLEYTAFNLNLLIGFICSFLGLLHFLNLGNLGKIPGLIGLGGGVIGFVLTFVYVIESGLVFDDIADNIGIRIDSDGAFLEWNSDKKIYTCIFYKKENKDSLYLKYSDYGNTYLNYRKDITFLTEEKNYKYQDMPTGCNFDIDSFLTSTNTDIYNFCKDPDETNAIPSGSPSSYYGDDPTKKLGDCEKIYYISSSTNPIKDNEKKIQYDRWLTTLILSCFIFLFNIGLAIFGFLLFRESNGSSGSVSIK